MHNGNIPCLDCHSFALPIFSMALRTRWKRDVLRPQHYKTSIAGDNAQIGNAATYPRLKTQQRLPMKREWFDAIVSGRKRVEFRANSNYWRSRLLKKSLQYVRLQVGYANTAPYVICRVESVVIMDVTKIADGLAPKYGTVEHRAMFGDAVDIICIHLGEPVERVLRV